MKAATKTQGVITQNVMADSGKPGQVIQPGVTYFSVQDGVLFGNDKTGKAVVMVPLAEVATAHIEVIGNG